MLYNHSSMPKKTGQVLLMYECHVGCKVVILAYLLTIAPFSPTKGIEVLHAVRVSF